MVSFLIFFLAMIKTTKMNNTKLTHNNLRKDKLKRDLQNESDNANIYYVNIFDYYFQDKYIILYSFSEPELPYNITLMMTLSMDKFNNSLGYWVSKEMDVRAYYYDDVNKIYYAYVEDLTLDNFEGEIILTILNITAESYNNNDTIYVSFEQVTYNFPEVYETDSSEEASVIILETDSSDIDNSYISDTIKITQNSDPTVSSVNFTSPGGGISSENSSIGIIIGVISGVIVFIAGIIIAIYFWKCRKKEIVIKTPPGEIKKSPPEDSILKLIFESMDQTIKIELSIDGNNTLKEMRRQFFNKINREDLMDEGNIFFLVNGQCFNIKSKGLVKDHLKVKNEINEKNDKKIHLLVVDEKGKFLENL